MQSSIPVIPITSGAGRYFWIGGLKSMVVKWQISIPQEKKSNCLDSIFSYKEWVLIEFQYIYFIHHEQFTGYRDGCMLQVHRHWQGWFSTRAKELNLLAKECVNPSLVLQFLHAFSHWASSSLRNSPLCLVWYAPGLIGAHPYFELRKFYGAPMNTYHFVRNIDYFHSNCFALFVVCSIPCAGISMYHTPTSQ